MDVSIAVRRLCVLSGLALAVLTAASCSSSSPTDAAAEGGLAEPDGALDGSDDASGNTDAPAGDAAGGDTATEGAPADDAGDAATEDAPVDATPEAGPDVSCIPSVTCASAGAECGTLDDGCGGTIECGKCTASMSCSSSHVCEFAANHICGSQCPPGTFPKPDAAVCFCPIQLCFKPGVQWTIECQQISSQDCNICPPGFHYWTQLQCDHPCAGGEFGCVCLADDF
jgi:hypothetical protein